MYPVIVDFGKFNFFGFEFHLAIYSFGFMLVVAFYSCYFLLERDLKRTGYDENLASDIVFWAALGGVFGAKIYYLVENFDRVIVDPTGMIFSGSGLVFLGGLLGGLLGVTMVLKKHNLPWLIFSDIVAPLLILGYGIGRIGCFLVGDDYGLPSSLPWAISFDKGLPPTNAQSFELYYPWIDISSIESFIIKVHPTQLYETIIAFLIFSFLWQQRKTIKNHGDLFFKYLFLAGVERFLIEFIRTNPKYLFNTFSGAQIISFGLVCIGIYFTIYPLGKSET